MASTVMHLDYTTHEGRRIPYFHSKQDAEQALLNGSIKPGEEIAISSDSFPGARRHGEYIFGQGLLGIFAKAASKAAGKEAAELAARKAAQRAAAEAAARAAAAKAAQQAAIAKGASKAAAEAAARDAAAAAARKAAAGATARSVAPTVAKGVTITAGVTAAAVGANTVIARLKETPEVRREQLPNGDILLTYPDGSTAIVDGRTGEVRQTSKRTGAGGTLAEASGLLKWGAVGIGVLVVSKVILDASSARRATASASKSLKAPGGAKPMAA